MVTSAQRVLPPLTAWYQPSNNYNCRSILLIQIVCYSTQALLQTWKNVFKPQGGNQTCNLLIYGDSDLVSELTLQHTTFVTSHKVATVGLLQRTCSVTSYNVT